MDLQKLMAEAQKMQNNLAKIEEELNAKEYVASNNGVTVTLTGKLEVTKIEIDPELIEKDNQEMLQDVIMIVVNSAIEQATNEKKEKLGAVTGGVQMPGMF